MLGSGTFGSTYFSGVVMGGEAATTPPAAVPTPVAPAIPLPRRVKVRPLPSMRFKEAALLLSKNDDTKAPMLFPNDPEAQGKLEEWWYATRKTTGRQLDATAAGLDQAKALSAEIIRAVGRAIDSQGGG